MEELPERLKRGPVTFHLRAQLAATGNSTKDPTVAWPDDRKVVELGVLTIDKACPTAQRWRRNCCSCPASSPMESRNPMTP